MLPKNLPKYWTSVSLNSFKISRIKKCFKQRWTRGQVHSKAVICWMDLKSFLWKSGLALLNSARDTLSLFSQESSYDANTFILIEIFFILTLGVFSKRELMLSFQFSCLSQSSPTYSFICSTEDWSPRPAKKHRHVFPQLLT